MEHCSAPKSAIGYADDNEARKGSCTPSMVIEDFLILPHNDRFRQTSWLFHWTARKKKSCTPSMVNEEKFFQWGDKHVYVYVLVGCFQSWAKFFVKNKNATSKPSTKVNPGDLFTC